MLLGQPAAQLVEGFAAVAGARNDQPPLRGNAALVANSRHEPCDIAVPRVHDDGVLMLSEFTGAAEELSQAHIVNPHDLDGLADTLESCLNADPLVARSKMHAMREHVRKHDVQSWAARFLSALEQSVAPSLRSAASAGEMAGAARLASS